MGTASQFGTRIWSQITIIPAVCGLLLTLVQGVVSGLCHFTNEHGHDEIKVCNRGCCGSTEATICCGLDGSVIAGYALGAIGALAFISLFVCVCVKKKLAQRGRVISTNKFTVQSTGGVRYTPPRPLNQRIPNGPNPFLHAAGNPAPGYPHHHSTNPPPSAAPTAPKYNLLPPPAAGYTPPPPYALYDPKDPAYPPASGYKNTQAVGLGGPGGAAAAQGTSPKHRNSGAGNAGQGYGSGFGFPPAYDDEGTIDLGLGGPQANPNSNDRGQNGVGFGLGPTAPGYGNAGGRSPGVGPRAGQGK